MSSLCIDLGSGLGGASAAFEDAGWDVVKLDLDKRFKPGVRGDYSRLPFKDAARPEMILAGPDCSCFSIMSIRFHWEKTSEGLRPKDVRTYDAIRDTLEMVEEIKRLEPEYAVVENPQGMMRHILGPPQHTIRWSDYGSPFKKPTDLWEYGRRRLQFKWLEGMGDWVHIPRKKQWRKDDALGIQGVKAGWTGAVGSTALRDDPELRAEISRRWAVPPSAIENMVRAPSLRAKWPYGLSKAILEAVQSKPEQTEASE